MPAHWSWDKIDAPSNKCGTIFTLGFMHRIKLVPVPLNLSINCSNWLLNLLPTEINVSFPFCLRKINFWDYSWLLTTRFICIMISRVKLSKSTRPPFEQSHLTLDLVWGVVWGMQTECHMQQHHNLEAQWASEHQALVQHQPMLQEILESALEVKMLKNRNRNSVLSTL